MKISILMEWISIAAKIDQIALDLMSLIWDADEIRSYMSMLGHEGPYLVFMSARKKYCPTIDKTRECFNRVIVRDAKYVPHVVESYSDDDLPPESLAVYFSVNPRNLEEAGLETATYIFSQLRLKNTEVAASLDKEFLRNAQKFQKKQYIVLDLDYKPRYEEIKALLIKHLITPKIVIETRGGFHFLVSIDTITRDAGMFIHKVLANMTFTTDDGKVKNLVDILSNPFSPLPGTIQGGFKVKMVPF